MQRNVDKKIGCDATLVKIGDESGEELSAPDWGDAGTDALAPDWGDALTDALGREYLPDDDSDNVGGSRRDPIASSQETSS